MPIKWLKKKFTKDDDAEIVADVIRKCEVYYIPCDRIRPNALRSRSDFDEDKLITLACSIKKYGIIEPLCVRRTDEGDAYEYELIVGERRLRAARLAELYSVPCIIIDTDERFSAEISLIENLYRADLDCFEVAFALKRLTELSEDSLESLACRLNISKDDIAKKLCLLELSFEERRILLDCGVSEEICAEIGGISDINKRTELIKLISQNGTSDKTIRSYIASFSRAQAYESSREINALIKGIRRKVELFDRRGKKVRMNVSNDGNSISIDIRIKP